MDDLPVMVQDVTFDGAELDFDRGLLRDTGFLGEQTMVNGTLDPYRTVSDELVRLRLLNASTARIYDFGFSDDRSFTMVATDGGLLEKPLERDRITLSPGERAEIVVRMTPGERTELRSFPARRLRKCAGSGDWQAATTRFEILELRADEHPATLARTAERARRNSRCPMGRIRCGSGTSG